jgi:putative endonuclease
MLGFFVYFHLMYFIYIIYSSTADRYYVGSCEDVIARLKKHNTNHSGFTGKKGDWEIKHAEGFSQKSEALQREKQIKGWKSRKMIENLLGMPAQLV